MSAPLRAIVFGAGYAGQGHTHALRQTGVDVVGMSSRTAAVGKKVASSLGLREYSDDWRMLMTATRPDIVAVGTPAGTQELGHIERFSDSRRVFDEDLIEEIVVKLCIGRCKNIARG